MKTKDKINYTKVGLWLVGTLIFMLLTGLVIAQITLTREDVKVSDVAQAERLGEVTATEYTCNLETCTYNISRAGAIYQRTFNATKDNQKAYEENRDAWYEEMIIKIKPKAPTLPTKELKPIQK